MTHLVIPQAELDRLLAENADLKAQLTHQPVAGQRQVTHWDDCWRAPDHHACAVAMIERLTARIAGLDAEIKQLLLDVVAFCWQPIKQEYDSMAVSTYADALRQLAERGVLTITRDTGRRVIAVPKVPQP